MNKTLAILLFSAVLFSPFRIYAQPSEALGIVSAPLANVHEEPFPKSPLMTQVLMGDMVRILEKKDNHYLIAPPDQSGIQGWVQQEALIIPKGRGASYTSTERPRIVIAAPKAEVLILDKTGNHKVSLYAGTRLPVLEQQKDSYKIQFPDRSIALIDAASAIAIKSPDPVINTTRPEEIASTARRFQGVRHLAGGMTAQGIDEGGLIAVSYRIHGISISRELGDIKDKGVRVSKKELEPGDILVFSGEREGLYLGSGQFLQVARKGTVQIAAVYDRRHGNAFQYGIRIIGVGADEKKRPAQMTAEDILLAQARAAQLPLGKRIAYWGARFIGTPYDPDPLGLYVRTNRIVADEKVDCMYHVFRSAELAQTTTPGEAVEKALALRFRTQGKQKDGLVTNYAERFEYGEDMVFSGKWGKNITSDLGETKSITGSRGKETVDILPKNILATRTLQKQLQDGDIIYWVKDPKKRVVEEIVAHLSIVRVKSGKPYVIHAAGDKDRTNRPGGGVVKEVPFADYVRTMRFIGAFVTRFKQ
ncbi:MAG TPA: NlpC/P60 family protein [Nitrospirota bacterium]|nr:NlpC/P60 family protein [Nitrospirota bacterium]